MKYFKWCTRLDMWKCPLGQSLWVTWRHRVQFPIKRRQIQRILLWLSQSLNSQRRNHYNSTHTHKARGEIGSYSYAFYALSLCGSRWGRGNEGMNWLALGNGKTGQRNGMRKDFVRIILVGFWGIHVFFGGLADSEAPSPSRSNASSADILNKRKWINHSNTTAYCLISMPEGFSGRCILRMSQRTEYFAL